MRTSLLVLVALLSTAFVATGDARSPGLAGSIVFSSDRGPNVNNRELFSIRIGSDRRRDLSRYQGDDGGPVWSPGGRRIAFWSIRFEGNRSVRGLYVMNPDGRGQRRLTPADLDAATAQSRPSWSPDGSRIAFAAEGQGRFGVYVVGADGTGLRLLAPNAGQPAWAPRGDRIAFVAAERRGQQFRNRIGLINGDGSGLTFLTDDNVDGSPVWAPDGRALVFLRVEPPEQSHVLYVIDADGRGLRRIAARTGDEGIGSISWRASGRIVFASGLGPLGPWHIWSVSPTGDGLRRLGIGQHPASSPSGKRIAFVRGRSLYVMNLDGSRLRPVLRTRKDFFSDGPVWSPEGRTLAFGSLSEPADYELYVASPDGTSLRRLTQNSVNERLPQWSPDHRRIAFVRGDPAAPSKETIWISSAAGTGARKLMRGTYPTWSPGGRRLAFSRGRSIYEISDSGGRARRVTAGTRPSWSPGGGKIAFVREGRALVVDLRSRVVRQLVDLDPILSCEDIGTTVEAPEWSPNAKQLIVVAGCDRGRTAFYGAVLVNADGSGPRLLPFEYVSPSRAAWSPDGSRVAFRAVYNYASIVSSARLDGSGRRTVTWSAADDRDPDW